jgi:hypothetical protein
VECPDAKRQTLRERSRLEYRQVVTAPSGKRYIVAASPRSLAQEPDQWPLPWPVVLVWVAIQQLVLKARRQPGWQVKVIPAWEPNHARIVARASKTDAIRRADAEASALTTGAA